MRMTRRGVLGGAAGLAAATARAKAEPSSAARPPVQVDVAVIGAGVFGAWTAEHLRRLGRKVALIDSWGPAHARASSGGESRITRTLYGPDELYAAMAAQSLPEWRALSDRAGLPVFAPTGVLFFGSGADWDRYATGSLDVNRRLGLPVERLGPAAAAARHPALAMTGVQSALFQPHYGVLMARRAVQTLVARFVASGGRYLTGQAAAPRHGEPMQSVQLSGALAGDRVAEVKSDCYVYACGPWLPTLFPELLHGRIRATRQEVFFFAPPSGSLDYAPARLPGWADWNAGDLHYGLPDLEARGVKFARDTHGPAIDPDAGDRNVSAEGVAAMRAYIARRFPGLKRAQLVESRVCQYENTSNGDFLIDRHPDHANVVLVGGGSGHGFKHGPEVGRYAARLALGTLDRAEPRFSLASKTKADARTVI